MLFYKIEAIVTDENITDEDLSTLTAEDIEMPKIQKEATKIKIGFAS